jgi:hypothetical protein
LDLSNLIASPDSEIPLCDDEEEFECDEDFLNDSGQLPVSESLPVQLLRKYLPWVGGFLAFVALALVLAWVFWRRFLAPSTDPQVTFRHLAFLGRLNAVGPAEYQTPYQYMYRLQDELPGHREQLSVIIGSYVRALYGRKETSAEEDAQLVRAWLELRMPLLFHLLRRRNRENEEV